MCNNANIEGAVNPSPGIITYYRILNFTIQAISLAKIVSIISTITMITADSTRIKWLKFPLQIMDCDNIA